MLDLNLYLVYSIIVLLFNKIEWSRTLAVGTIHEIEQRRAKSTINTIKTKNRSNGNENAGQDTVATVSIWVNVP